MNGSPERSVRTLDLPCPRGFRFHATAETLRRGPADPLVWYDGRRWRRRVSGGRRLCLVEVSDAAAGDAGEAPPRPDALHIRILAGRASDEVLARTVSRIFGLDDPGAAAARRLPERVRRTIRGCRAALPGYPTLFEALAQTVLGQQLHVAVANAHRAAFVRAFGTPFRFRRAAYWAFPAPADVAGARTRRLRGLGLSAAKAASLRAIAREIADGRLTEERLRTLPAADAIAALSALPGVGRWTSEWVLLRGLRRFEIVPAGDLAVRKAVGWLRGAGAPPPEETVRGAAAAWFPYGGLVAFRLLVVHRQTIG